LKKIRYYMLWDCSSCDTKGYNANTCKQCAQCGSPKELDDHLEQEYRSSTKVNENYRHSGADISCQSCSTENKKRFSCRNCGDALDAKFAKQVAKFPTKSDGDWRKHSVQANASGYIAGTVDTPWQDSCEVPAPPAAPLRPSVRTRVRGAEQKMVRAAVSLKEPEVRRNPRTWFIIAGIGILLAVTVMGALWAYNKYSTITAAEASISGVSWSYSLPLEDYAPRDKQYVTENSWWEPPEEAININDRRVVVRTEDIIKDVWVTSTCQRTEDNSYNDTDGTWVRLIEQVDYDCSGYQPQKTGENDIWGTRWTYQLYEWERTTPLTAGNATYDVVFPTFQTTDTLRASGSPVTRFSIEFSYTLDGENKTDERIVPQDVWEATSFNQTFAAVVDGFGTLRAISGIDPDYEVLVEQLQ